jgi:hypothetical protein
MLITAYPLTWPPHLPRTPNNKRSLASYRAGFVKARDELLNELRLFGADDVVISSNIPLRKDGLPGANFKEPPDPGISVYFRIAKQSHAICCDAWDKVKDNLRAIGEHIAALRMIRNCRVTPVELFLAEYAIKSYILKLSQQAKSKKKSSSSRSDKKRDTRSRQQRTKAKSESDRSSPPNASQQHTSVDWRGALGVVRGADFDIVRSAYHRAAKIYHPDSGSHPDSEKMKAINIAFENAKLEYGK